MKTTDNGICERTYIHRGKVASAKKGLPGAPLIDQMAETFQMLSDPTRLKICMALAREELCVCDIAALLAMTNSAVSHQLALLKHLRMVRNRKEGKMVYYSLDDEHVEDLIRISKRHGEER